MKIISERLKFDELEYHISIEEFEYSGYKIAYPYFSICNKSTKKVRDKKLPKGEMKFKIVEFQSPSFAIKLYVTFKRLLKDYDVIVFYPYKDQSNRRKEVYSKGLENMGFKKIWSDSQNGYTAHSKTVIKRKELFKMLWSCYYESAPETI